MPWVLLFVAIGVVGLVVLGRLLLGVWRSARGLLEELDVLAVRAGELADLLARVEVPAGVGVGAGAQPTDSPRTAPEEAWPGTVETYDDRGAPAPGKKEP